MLDELDVDFEASAYSVTAPLYQELRGGEKDGAHLAFRRDSYFRAMHHHFWNGKHHLGRVTGQRGAERSHIPSWQGWWRGGSFRTHRSGRASLVGQGFELGQQPA